MKVAIELPSNRDWQRVVAVARVGLDAWLEHAAFGNEPVSQQEYEHVESLVEIIDAITRPVRIIK